MNRSEYFGAPAHLRSAQAQCDLIQAEFRARQLPSTPAACPTSEKKPLRRADAPPIDAALIPTEDQLSLRLADELEYARRMLEAMGDELAADMGVVMRHAVALQSVDIIGQMLGHIAAVTRSSTPAGAFDRIGMGDLKARLTRKAL